MKYQMYVVKNCETRISKCKEEYSSFARTRIHLIMSWNAGNYIHVGLKQLQHF